MNILMICNKSPWPPKEGGPIAMNMIVEGLISKGHKVKVLAVNSYKYHIREEDIPLGYKEQCGIELIDVDLRVRPIPALLNLFTGKSYHVERFISGNLKRRLTEILQTDRFDVIQLETLYVAPYITTLRAYSNARIVLRAHNIEHLIWSRVADTTQSPLKRWYIRHLARTLRNYELRVIQKVDGIAAITEKDRKTFCESYPSQVSNRNAKHETRNAKREKQIISIPFGINLNDYPPPEPYTGPVDLFSIGAMNWIPNTEGIRWFLHHVWPDLHKEFPDLKYYLAGRAMPSWMFQMKYPGVVVLGEVDDAREFIASHGIMIVPLFSGSGIRIKIIEGMASGKVIVSTQVGAEGIDFTNGKNIFIANTPCEFVDIISLCISDPEKIMEIGSEARKLIESRYDRSQIIDKLIAFYELLIG